MRMYKLEKVDAYYASKFILDALGLPANHTNRTKVEDAIYDNNLEFAQEFKKRESTFAGRITIPLFLVVYLLMFLAAFIKYVVTGSYHFTGNDKFSKFILNWWENTGLRF